MSEVSSQLCSSGTPVSRPKAKKPWKDAASLIIVAPRISSSKDDVNYHILFLKRAARSFFFPNSFVFPGGVTEEADKSPRWFELFRKVDPRFDEKIPNEFFVRQNDGKRPPLFPGDINALNNGILPNEVAFRICAIRESFEESGVLILTDNVEVRRADCNSVHAASVTNLLSPADVVKWRSKIRNDADEFFNLCKQLKRVPDIWSLKEWSEWLGPKVSLDGKNSKRYDAVFYACCLKETPADTMHDKVEMSESTWNTPKEMLEMFSNKKATLPPPQLMELSRLLNFRSMDGLFEYMQRRALMGLERWLPFFCVTKCGQTMGLFPGDDLYPVDFDVEEGQEEYPTIDKTVEDIMTTTDNVFCVFFPKLVGRCNITPYHGQVPPVYLQEVYPRIKPMSKL